MDKNDKPWIDYYDAGIAWDAPLDAVPVHTLLERSAQKFPQRPAFDSLGFKLTWHAVAQQVDRFALALQARGVQKGDHIGLFLPNCPYYLIAYYAVLKTGASVVNLNPLYAPQELAHLIEDSGLTRIITLDLKLTFEKIEPMLASTCLNEIIVCPFTAVLPFPKRQLFSVFKGKELGSVRYTRRILSWDALMDSASDHRWVAPSINPHEDVAVLQYTGGTTGLPKGAMLTHANVVANAQQCRLWFQNVQVAA